MTIEYTSSLRNPPPVRGPDQDGRVVVGSPLAVVGIFVAVLRERFKLNNGPSDWVWDANLNETGVVIESGFASPQNTERGKKPAIFIDKDESVYGRMIIGDRAGVNLKSMADYQWTLSTVPVLIDCVGSVKGESAVIGDVVQWTIHCASDAIRAAFSLHDISPPTLGRTVPYEAEKEAWTTPVSFQIQHDVRWSTTPISPLIQEMRAHLRPNGVEAHLIEIATFTSGTSSD